MSRRNRSRGNPVSLFAFQDIITSVTAIMILLVLILTLEFVTRARKSGVAHEHLAVAEDLDRTVRDAEARLVTLNREFGVATQAARRVTAMSPTVLEHTINRERTRQAALERSIAAAQAVAKRAEDERRSAENRLVETAAAARDATRLEHDAARTEAAAKAQESTNQRNRARHEALVRQGDAPSAGTLIFNPAKDDGKSAVMVEIAADGVTLLHKDKSGRESLGWTDSGPSSAFGRWLATFPKSRAYVVIMLRPSGIELYRDVRDAITKVGIDVGTELIPEDMAIVVHDAGSAR